MNDVDFSDEIQTMETTDYKIGILKSNMESKSYKRYIKGTDSTSFYLKIRQNDKSYLLGKAISILVISI